MIGLYVPGDSLLHRAQPTAKLVMLMIGTAAVVMVRTTAAVAVAAAVVLIGYAVARLSPRDLGRQLYPLRWFVLVLLPLQWWQGGPGRVAVVLGTMVVTVAAAALVTLTTRVMDMLDVVERAVGPLRHVGVRPERVALLLALTIRAIPVLAATMDDVRDARRARGLERSPRALLVPLVIRTLRHADQLGEALVARGVDD